MMKDKNLLKRWALTVIFCLGHAAVSFAGGPGDDIKVTVARVIGILHEPVSNGLAAKTERRQMIRQILLPRFDFAEMAKRSLGNHWRSLNGNQEEFVSAFTDFVENSFMIKIESFKDEQIAYVGQRIDTNFAQVDTKIVPLKGEPFSVSYKLHLVGGEWKVYDVVIENISLVNNFRSQFNRILTTASFDELLRKLREKGSGRES